MRVQRRGRAPLSRRAPAAPTAGRIYFGHGPAAQGTKLSVLTEATGVPVGVAVAGANRQDVILIAATLASIPVPGPRPTTRWPQGVCLEQG